MLQLHQPRTVNVLEPVCAWRVLRGYVPAQTPVIETTETEEKQ